MTRTCHYRLAALHDIDAITERLDQVDPRLSERFENAIRHLAELALAQPGIGRPVDNLKSPLHGARCLIPSGFRNHVFYYQEASDGIHVLRVLHGARNIELLE